MDLDLPKCSDDSLNYYKYRNLYFTSAEEDFEAAMHDSVNEGEHLFTCQFSNEDAFEEAVSRISRGMYVKMAARYQGQAATSGMVYNEKTYTVILFY